MVQPPANHDLSLRITRLGLGMRNVKAVLKRMSEAVENENIEAISICVDSALDIITETLDD